MKHKPYSSGNSLNPNSSGHNFDIYHFFNSSCISKRAFVFQLQSDFGEDFEGEGGDGGITDADG